MKKLIVLTIAAVIVAMMPSLAAAQAGNTASGTLTVTATVNSSIQLVFVSDGSGVGLTGSGTNNATLPFGTVQAFGGSVPAGATKTTAANSFTLSSPVDVVVTKANSSSANYKLTAQLGAAPSNGESFTVNGTSVVNASAATISATASYGTTVATVALTIPFTVASGTTLSDAINFTATSN